MSGRIIALLLCTAAGAAAQTRLETAALRFEISPATGITLTDKTAGVDWHSGGSQLGDIAVALDGRTQRFPLLAFEADSRPGALALTFHPIPSRPAVWIRLNVSTPGDGRWLDLSYKAAPDLKVEEIRLPGDAFPIRSGEGYVVVPVRESLFIPADSASPSGSASAPTTIKVVTWPWLDW